MPLLTNNYYEYIKIVGKLTLLEVLKSKRVIAEIKASGSNFIKFQRRVRLEGSNFGVDIFSSSFHPG